MDVHPEDDLATAEDLAFEEQVARGVGDADPGSRTLGAAFLFGVIVGVTASSLLRSAGTDDDAHPRRPRLLVRRREPAEPPSLGRALQDETARVARGLVRDLGRVASRWILEGPRSRAPDGPAEPGEDAASGQ